MKIDMSGADNSTKFEPLEEGTYLAKIAKIEKRESKAGNTYLQFDYVVLDDNGKARHVWENYPLVPKALWKFKELLDALGISSEGEIDFEPSEVLGREINVYLKVQEDDRGNLKNTVNSPSSADGDSDSGDFFS